ncbi:MAG: SLC13 family permease [Parvibaculum sp.]|uniref:SLC13 family permease n=1 Tax=Parvibaculum sp. TaxID=2024848 RepID=UPI00271D8493|nr:SLC13 family permease [Parvibaculum sp.]MDO8838381.1 SLC13 family permease [Parvibaculum sp.]
MTQDQAVILAILAGTVAMFVWGRWRHDMVALASLLACVLTGLVPSVSAFAGFGHPAVITVACVLILSSGLQQSGAVDVLTRIALPQSAGALTTIAALTGLAAVLSAFMNNVGALALLMPVAVQVAAKQNLPPGKVLMPLAFGSILGGMTTLIGTPPNLIVSGFRNQTDAGSFAMFDFAPVGLAVAAVGVIFVVIFSRWLVPVRERAGTEGFETGAYLTEARVTEKSKAKGMTLREIDKVLEEADAQVIGLVRDEVRIPAPSPFREIVRGDILVIEAEPEGLVSALSALGLKLEEDVRNTGKEEAEEGDEVGDDTESKDVGNDPADDEDPKDKRRKAIQSDDVILMELAVLPDSAFVGRSATDVRLRTRYDINLLAVSRQGQRSMARLRTMTIQPGDVLLMQGRPETLNEFASQFGCVPLAERALRIPEPRQALTASGIMAAAVGGAAFGLVPAAVSFAGGVLASMVFRVISPRTIYNAVDWPVIVLLGALIPVAGAMATTGAADLIARVMLETLAQGHAVIALTLILVVTMTLSDFMNNAATAAVMCPVAIGTADQLGASADPFLMAVAVGASCAFLTPIGHQNNTLILGPGGFGFGDYWRLGLPLELIVIAVGVPMLLLVWPL